MKRDILFLMSSFFNIWMVYHVNQDRDSCRHHVFLGDFLLLLTDPKGITLLALPNTADQRQVSCGNTCRKLPCQYGYLSIDQHLP